MLTFIPTPIGNLGDISARALEVLSSAQLIICEDTRVSKALLARLKERYEVEFAAKTFVCLNSHNADSALAKLDAVALENAAYLSDAGMPCISDPGSDLIRHAQKLGLNYCVLPGASASLCALAASGFSDKEFLFYGFLNIKKQRQAQLEMLLSQPFAVVLYESPKRVLELAYELARLAPEREIHAVKEISKLHERHFHARASELPGLLEQANTAGEWVFVIRANDQSFNTSAICEADIYELDLAPRAKAKLLSKINGRSVKQNYEELQK